MTQDDPPLSQDFVRELFKHVGRAMKFMAGPDRATAILAAAWLDELLLEALRAHLLPPMSPKLDILDQNGPLGTFSSRIEAANRLGLIDAQFARALHLVRRIRNDFAHDFDADSLADSPHREWVRELSAPFAAYPEYATFETRSMLYKRHKGPAADFRVAASILATQLLVLTGVPKVQPRPLTAIPPRWSKLENRKQRKPTRA